MSALARLARKSNLTDADIARIAAAVAGHAGHHAEAPAMAPQSPRVAALLRSVQTHVPAPERPTAPPAAPAATAHRSEAAIAPRPALSPIPTGEVPCVVHRDELGRALSVSWGDVDVHVVARDENGRIAELAADNGYSWKITRRDANGHLAGFVVTLPTRGVR